MNSESIDYAQFIGVGVLLLGVASILVWGLLKAGKLPPSVALVISLSLLTLVAMIGFIVTIDEGSSAELATLAGTGLGALAGAVTAVWADREQSREEVALHPVQDPIPDDEGDGLAEDRR